MEVPALCNTPNVLSPVGTVWLLLVAQVDFGFAQRAAFPQVVPDRQQFFQHESISVSCEGLEGQRGWRVMRKVKGQVMTCSGSWSTSTGPCEIKHAYKGTDSGEYWCELGGHKKTNSVTITVTDDSLILVIPAHPLLEGDAVTLTCMEKNRSSNPNALFYKVGYLMDKSPTGNLTIHSVSKSNEGLYKCKTTDGRRSAESWLAVRAAAATAAEDHEEAQPFSHQTLIILGVCVVVVLLLMGLLGWWKRQAVVRAGTTTSSSSVQPSFSPQAVAASGEATVVEQTTYAAVTKPRKKRGSPADEPLSVYSTVCFGGD